MGARQSVAQPPRHRASNSTSNADGGRVGQVSSSRNARTTSTDSSSIHYTNGHTPAGDPSTSGAGDSGQNRTGSSLVFHSSASAMPSTSHQTSRSRQARSLSVNVPSPDFFRDASSSSGQTIGQSSQRQQQQHYRPQHYSVVARDQSSDSSGGGGESDGGNVMTGIPSLDRLLRLNSAIIVGSGSGSTSSAGSVPAAVWLPPVAFRQCDVKCPVCSKTIPSDNVEYHLVVCLTRPRIAYNEDVLTEDKGECVICFEDMSQGDTIARLPCLCVYHKGCIDAWFKVKNSCPEHPGDD